MTNLVLNTSPSVSTDQIDMFVGNEDGSIMYPTGSPQAKEIIQSLSFLDSELLLDQIFLDRHPTYVPPEL
ncbi:MAG: hypothetical protein WDO06_00335 [Actinomycetota bacterium]